jgi:hypothetical protein
LVMIVIWIKTHLHYEKFYVVMCFSAGDRWKPGVMAKGN